MPDEPGARCFPGVCSLDKNDGPFASEHGERLAHTHCHNSEWYARPSGPFFLCQLSAGR